MRPSISLLGILAVGALLAACSGDDDESGRLEVQLLAGGGENTPGGDPAEGADTRLGGAVTALTSGPDETLWAVVDGTSMVEIDDDGVRAVDAPLPDGGTAVTDLAVAPDGTVYALVDGGTDASVYALDGDSLVPAFGVPATPEQVAGTTPPSPDGVPAQDASLGQVVDLTVDADGRVVFAESLLAEAAELTGVSMVRAVDDGDLVTLAGQEWPDATTGPETDEVRQAAVPADGAAATDIDLLGPVALATTPEGAVLVRTGWSVLSVADDESVSVILGSGSDSLPTINADGPFSGTTSATDAEYRAILGPKGFSSGQDGAVATGVIGNLESLGNEDRTPYEWQIEDGSERAQEIADARTAATETHATVITTPGGEVVTADLAADDAAWYGDDELALAFHDTESGESVIVTVDVPDEFTS